MKVHEIIETGLRHVTALTTNVILKLHTVNFYTYTMFLTNTRYKIVFVTKVGQENKKLSHIKAGVSLPTWLLAKYEWKLNQFEFDINYMKS